MVGDPERRAAGKRREETRPDLRTDSAGPGSRPRRGGGGAEAGAGSTGAQPWGLGPPREGRAVGPGARWPRSSAGAGGRAGGGSGAGWTRRRGAGTKAAPQRRGGLRPGTPAGSGLPPAGLAGGPVGPSLPPQHCEAPEGSCHPGTQVRGCHPVLWVPRPAAPPSRLPGRCTHSPRGWTPAGAAPSPDVPPAQSLETLRVLPSSWPLGPGTGSPLPTPAHAHRRCTQAGTCDQVGHPHSPELTRVCAGISPWKWRRSRSTLALLWSSWGEGDPEFRAAPASADHSCRILSPLTSSEVVALSTSQDSSGHLTPLKTGQTAWEGGRLKPRRAGRSFFELTGN